MFVRFDDCDSTGRAVTLALLAIVTVRPLNRPMNRWKKCGSRSVDKNLTFLLLFLFFSSSTSSCSPLLPNKEIKVERLRCSPGDNDQFWWPTNRGGVTRLLFFHVDNIDVAIDWLPLSLLHQIFRIYPIRIRRYRPSVYLYGRIHRNLFHFPLFNEQSSIWMI